jgi:hypothetical protein
MGRKMIEIIKKSGVLYLLELMEYSKLRIFIRNYQLF